MYFACNRCTSRHLSFDSSVLVEVNVVSMALSVAMFVSGNQFADVQRSLGLGLIRQWISIML